MTLALLTNSDLVTQLTGTIVRRGILANTCLLAQADILAHCQNLLGVRPADVASGASGTVASLANGMRVVLDGAASAGDAIYLSATVGGRGTNVAPNIQILLGRAYDVQSIAGTYYASLIVSAAALDSDGFVLATQLPQALSIETYIFPPLTGPGVYSGTLNLNALTRSFFFWMVAAGGAGGGAAGGSAGNISVGSGGGGGGYREGMVVVVPGVTSVAWVIGQGGTGVSGGVGNTGGNSTLTYNGTVIATCTGGTGGQVMSSGNTPATINAGSLGNGTPSTSIVVTGSNGTSGLRWSGTVGLAGMGGPSARSAWSGGSRNSDGDGDMGLRQGGGGAGAFATTTNRTGGAGRDGALVVQEYD